MDATTTNGRTTARAADPVTLQVVNQRLQSIADEMQTVLCRSAFSSIIKEAQDASAGLFDREGGAIAQAAALPGHLGTLGPAVKRVLAIFPAHEMSPGDVFCFNDPYQGGTHLPDFTVIIPVFSGGEVVALSVTMAHHQDVGGAAPGSTPPNVTEIFAEGIRLPPVRLYVRGEPNRDVLEILKLNTRTPDFLQGDLRAQLAAGNIGRRRLEALFEEYGRDALRQVFHDLLDYAERLTRLAIEAVPDGRYTFEDFLDHDGIELDRPIKIRATVEIRGSSFHVDFTGTGAQAKGPMNSVEASTLSAVYYVVRTLAGAAVPNNQGVYRPVEVYAPPGTIVNPEHPAPVGCRTHTMKRTADVLLGALAQALPGQLPAASSGQVAVMFVGGRHRDTGNPFVTFIGVPFAGGMGARPSKDGLDVVATDLNNEMNIPVEACEMSYPMQFEYLHLWPDSGGPGRQRGGLGYTARCRWLGDRAVLSQRRDRHDFAPWGVEGGKPAPTCRTNVIRQDGRVEALPSKILTHLDPGDAIEIYTTGGGGYGDPLDRDPRAVLDDVIDGRVSVESAERDYGVVAEWTAKVVDVAATASRRRSLREGAR